MNGHIVTRTGKKTIKGKPEKLYYAVYYVNGKQKWEKVRSGEPEKRKHAIKEDAQKILTKRLSEINAGEYLELKRATFAEFKDKWMTLYAEGHIRHSSLATFKGFFENHLIPAFGHKQLTAIGVEDIEDFKAQKMVQPKDQVRKEKDLKGSSDIEEQDDVGALSPQTVKHLLRLLRQVLDYAVELGYLRNNPSRKVKYPKIPRMEMEVYTPAEVVKLLEHTPEKWRAFFLVAISTGLRVGELLAMRWKNLDWNGGQYFVKETWQRPRDGRKAYFSEPKTESSVAPVDLMPEALEALKEHQQRQAAEKLKAGEDYKDQDLIFATPAGGPLDDANVIQRVYKHTVKEARLRQIRFHDLRHTAASILIASKQSPKYIQKQMRHASIDITFDRYGHLFPDANREAMMGMSSMLFGEKKETQQKALAVD